MRSREAGSIRARAVRRARAAISAAVSEAPSRVSIGAFTGAGCLPGRTRARWPLILHGCLQPINEPMREFHHADGAPSAARASVHPAPVDPDLLPDVET